MRLIIGLFLVVSFNYCFGQHLYSKNYDITGGQEATKAMLLKGDSVLIRMTYVCDTTLCTMLGIFSHIENTFLKIYEYEEIQSGLKNIIQKDSLIIISSEERKLNKNISISKFNKYSLNLIIHKDLYVDSIRYFNYAIGPLINYFNKVVVGANALDSTIYVDYQGWNNYQEKTILFVLDDDFNTDTILIVPPSSGAFMKIEDMAIGSDSILYISFYEKYLKQGNPNLFLEIRKVIYGYNQNMQKKFEWIGPDFDAPESLTRLTIGKDSIVYFNYKHNFRSYLAALNTDGSLKWECLFDSNPGNYSYSVRRLLITKNGDILGAGVISSAFDELGESGFVFRVDSQGHLLWKRAIRINKGMDLILPPEFPFRSNLEDIVELPNGDLLASGYVRKYVGYDKPGGPYNEDIWIIRTNEEGCLWPDCSFIQDIVSKDQYMRLVNSENEWVVDVISPPLPTVINRYSFDPDSVLIRDAYYYELIYTSSVQGDWQETGRWMRQDNGKIYELDTSDSTDILLYDFDLQIGDTLQSPQIDSNSIKKVIGVSTTNRLKSNDLIQKILTIECTSDAAPSDTTVWIEGMGDVERLFWTKTYCAEEDSNTTVRNIRCFLSSQQVLYARPEFGDCYITAVEEPYQATIKVYPNPTHDKLHFDVPEDQFIHSVSLFNGLGQNILHAKLLWNNTLDVSTLPVGIYFCALDFQNGSTRMFKFLIQ